MRDRKEERKWGVILAREFNVPPDDIDLETFLDCVSRSKLVDGGQFLASPDNAKEEKVLCGPFAGMIIEKLVKGNYPFNDWLYTTLGCRGEDGPNNNDFPEGFLN